MCLRSKDPMSRKGTFLVHGQGTSNFLIYGLLDPRDRLIRYVGKSSSGITRAKQHLQPSRRAGENPDTNTWLDNLTDDGAKYEIVVLDYVDDPLAHSRDCWWWTGINSTALYDRERWWIAYGRASGWPLTNNADGGDGKAYGDRHPMRARPELAQRVADALRGQKMSPEACANMSEAAKLRWSDPEQVELMRENRKQRMNDPIIGSKIRKAVSDSNNRRWSDPVERERIIQLQNEGKRRAKVLRDMETLRIEDVNARMSKRPVSDKLREAVRESHNRRWADPEERARLLHLQKEGVRRAGILKAMKRLRKDYKSG